MNITTLLIPIACAAAGGAIGMWHGDKHGQGDIDFTPLLEGMVGVIVGGVVGVVIAAVLA